MIGLIRHFKVQLHPTSSWLTADQFLAWIEQYDQAPIQVMDTQVRAEEWEVCFSSSLSRATRTASSIIQAPIIRSELLKEIELYPIGKIRVKLHITMWLILARIAWLVSHSSQRESKRQADQRAQQFIESIENDYPDKNVLIVSHGAFIRVLAKELKRRGYRGKTNWKPKNGKLYRYTRK